jgi:hypothetical protein
MVQIEQRRVVFKVFQDGAYRGDGNGEDHPSRAL